MAEMETLGLGDTTAFSQTMRDIAEHLNERILVKLLKRPTIWYSLFPKETYPNGQGYTQKTITFHPGMGDLAGLTSWEELQPSRPPKTNGPDDPGYDACTYKVKQFDYGFTEREFKGYRTARKSPAVCYNDVQFKWQFAQQLEKIFGFMTEITQDVWENLAREAYIDFARKVVLTNQPDAFAFSYNPFSSTEITVSQAVFSNISMLSMSHLNYWREYMKLACPEGAAGSDSGIPVFELVVDAVDIDQMIKENEKFREAFLYAQPNFLLEGYGKVKSFMGWAFLLDPMAARFTVKGTSGSNVVLERVLPYIEESATIGKMRRPNPEYIKAEYALCAIRPKNTYKFRIPASAKNIAGLKFGPVPSWAGDFYAINIPDEEKNPLGEKCYFFARYAAFLEPLENIDDAVVILYKRCQGVERITCSTPSTNNTVNAIAGSGEAVDVNEDGKYTKVRITFNGNISKAAPTNITVTFADSTTASAILSGDGNAPTYEITFSSANVWLTVGGGIASITVA